MSLQQITRDLVLAGIVGACASAEFTYVATRRPSWTVGAAYLGLWAGPIVWAALCVAVAAAVEALEWRLACRAIRRREVKPRRPVR